ncbi:DUF3037 domain-containing protein [Sphaerisporangium sp. NBC_01403]|uniref:DUF3037 domain-containing protein n=1 Tax=Sphaerisporangium sp. NBC_01403 TaxID=2903599 RepID=UPI0032539D00
MSRYIYSIVRCLPDPRTGEFVNVGAIAGDPNTGDWAVRRLSNTERIKRFALPTAIDVTDRFLVRLSSEVAEAREVLETEGSHPFADDWLLKLHHDHRNIVQLSPPASIVAGHAEAALDIIFDRMIIDPATQPRQVTVGKEQCRISERPTSLLAPEASL